MKIVYFAPIAFNGLKQRPQHIAELLSKKHEIWYVEPTISLMRYILKGGRSYKKEKYDINSNLHIIKLDGKFTAHISFQAIDYFKINTVSEKIQLSKMIENCDIIWVGYCGWYDIISNINDKKIVYDKMDDDASITQNKLLSNLIQNVEPKLIKKADVIFVTAIKFYQELSLKRDYVFYVPNAFNKDIEFNVQNKVKEDPGNIIFGYVGTIAHWFDMKAIEIILAANEKNYLYLVGPLHIPKIKHDRIKYIGEVPKKEIGEYINSFDVCLYPFVQSSFLDTIDPVKIYEYLALNKPVIAVDSVETRKYGNLINRYHDYNELEEILQLKLDSPFINKEECIKYLEDNTWEKRVEIIEEYL